MRRTARQKFVFLLGNPQALVVVLICLCTSSLLCYELFICYSHLSCFCDVLHGNEINKKLIKLKQQYVFCNENNTADKNQTKTLTYTIIFIIKFNRFR